MRFINDPPKGKIERLDLRRPAGFYFSDTARGGAYAYQLYHITYDDLTSEICRGEMIRNWGSTADLNGPKAERERSLKTFHPELTANIKACAVLSEKIGSICWEIDMPEQPTKKTRKRR